MYVEVASMFMLVTAAMCAADGAPRDKRYIFFNTHAPITLGIQIYVPTSVALPSLVPGPGPAFARTFQLRNMDGDVALSSVQGRVSHLSSIMEDDILPEDLIWQPSYKQSLRKLYIYFAHLEVISLLTTLITETVVIKWLW
nr:uncharacterized protein LOC128704770 [Cherax quadricarinatus]